MWWQKDIAGCGIAGFIHKKGKLFSGEVIRKAIVSMEERGNGLGAGFAAYGIYPQYKDQYALHVMCTSKKALEEAEKFIKDHVEVVHQEEIPTTPLKSLPDVPYLWRYFVQVNYEKLEGTWKARADFDEDNYIVWLVMEVNKTIEGAYIFSSGKDMGTFKGVGTPAQMADFYRIEEYEGYIWIAHNRFPTNTPGWWGGAHPFTLLDWSIVHNGEISSYGINKRYLEMFGYVCTLLTDTEVVAYLLDLLLRRQKLPLRAVCSIFAPPLWDEIDWMPEDEKRLYTALRMVYGSALLNGPFAILFASHNRLVGLNDRIKLRPLVVATKDEMVFMASEESAIREICPFPDKVWAPKAGEPVVVELEATT